MKISIITVCYNAEKTIRETLESVASQNYPEFEHIIVDGGSSDGTLEIVREFEKGISKIISERDNGIYYAMNKGLLHASGDVVGFLNADDAYASNNVLEQISSAFKNHAVESCYADLQYVNSSDPDKILRNWKAGSFDSKKFLNGWMPPHPTFYCRRELFEKYGQFNTQFSISADYELMLRFLYKNGCSSVYVPKLWIKMKVGGASNQSIKNRIKANNEDRMAWKVNGLKMRAHTTFLKPIRKIAQFWN